MSNRYRACLSQASEFQLFLYRKNPHHSLEDSAGHIRAQARSIDGPAAMELSVNNIAKGEGSIAGEIASDNSLPDLVLSLFSEHSDALYEQARCTAEAVGPQINTGSSSVLACRRLEILPGQGPVRIFYGLRRLEHLTRQAFQQYWLREHAPIGRQLIPPYSYFQSHSDTGLTQSFARDCQLPASELDGVVEIHFPDLAACQRQLAREDVGTIALEDEKRFIDHRRVAFGIYSVSRIDSDAGG